MKYGKYLILAFLSSYCCFWLILTVFRGQLLCAQRLFLFCNSNIFMVKCFQMKFYFVPLLVHWLILNK